MSSSSVQSYLASLITNDATEREALCQLSVATLAKLIDAKNGHTPNVEPAHVEPANNSHDAIAGFSVGDTMTYKNERKGAFKTLKTELRRDYRVSDRRGQHDKTKRLTVWSQRRTGKKALYERAELKHGALFNFVYSPDYSTVDVTRVR